jgi:diguanylate cyclase (GGDEF)-like protein/PAS domain S-box-containing protein
MPQTHPLLVRQLERLGLADGGVAPSAEQWRQFLQRVARAYQEADQDRYLLERSQDLASAEMTELYRALAAEKAQLESRVNERTSKLRESEAHLAEAQRIATLGSWTYVPQTHQLEWSEECYRLFGLDSGAGPPTSEQFLALVHPGDRQRLRKLISASRHQGANGDTEFRIVRENAHILWLHAIEETFTNAAGQVILMRGTMRDITLQKQAEVDRDRAMERLNVAISASKLAEERLRQSESRFRSLLALSSDWYWEQDAQLRFTEVAGMDPQRDRLGVGEFLGQTGLDHGQLQVGEADFAHYQLLTAARLPFRDLCHTARDADGEWRFISFSGEPVFDGDGQFAGYRGIARDTTQSRRADEKILRLAHFDELTGLPNRTMFMQTLKRAFSLALRRGKQFALFFIDLDRFKNINDSLGHESGDLLLQDVARRLRDNLRESDSVARLGGDEFVVLVEDCADPRELNAIAQNILNAVGRPYVLSGQEYHVTGSIGISTYPIDGQDPAALLKNADIAMYLAKDRGKNNFQFYSAQQNAHSFERLALESALQHALGRDEFVLHYQPKVDIASGRIVGVEALLRWNHPDLAMVLPNQFIPLAEETGLIVPIGRWVLRTACVQSASWRREGMPALRMAVNLSARQFSDDGLIDDISDALAQAELAPDGLELEITESMVMQNPERAVTTLNRLREMGITVSIDDFGTGYSSLGYLKRFPIDNVKVDRSFIKDLPHDSDDAAITRAVIAMAQSLRIRVIAEGVETREQLQFLRDHDCDECQGYLLSRPLPAGEFAVLVRTWRDELSPSRDARRRELVST